MILNKENFIGFLLSGILAFQFIYSPLSSQFTQSFIREKYRRTLQNLLISPISILIANEMEISPMPFLLTQIFGSNIGGTATLIGDPPNIMIASKSGLDFMDFILHLTPAIIIILLI